jgi:HSP20 family molecular chaperone IbpA
MIKKNYTRFSMPSRVLDLLYSDDEFYRYVIKNKKVKEIMFPKYNTYKGSDGFHMYFALAGYSSKDIAIEYFGDELVVRSNTDSSPPDGDALDSAKSSVQHGYIVRGIARRKFTAKFQISNLFDITNATASMKDGELHIIIPECNKQPGTIDIKYISDEV